MMDKLTQGIFYGIGVGVGDSDYVTKRAVDVIKTLNVLYVPSAKEKEGFSTAYKIIKDYVDEKTVVKIRHFPMNYDNLELQKTWESIALEIEKDVSDNMRVGFVTIGDPMVYSTYIYLLKILKKKVNVVTIPGITSFLDIASNNNFPLVEGDDPLVILPATIDEEKLRRYVKNENSIVLMKVYNNFDKIVSMLVDENLSRHAIIVSNSSKDEEVVYKNIEQIKKEDVSYFTTILINKRWELS
ncbi:MULTISPECIES: precorrin-2 C(20)-methyltransferase [unclassified Sedimentibacter]|uniref:precorrin-2 C(20)-methyltransferase n=1 Tax=unclassified Sedimentibacter TaxID=2649220 RepID=UPI0027DFA236|nr:precorrin-2 C(20)-methyltransferase [Sedimentibacter sp. MB35-C1]WMJ78361.1 precorrin-2 C(20)-methyltransferase [Sedimentibacter sp. MB35-C1]